MKVSIACLVLSIVVPDVGAFQFMKSWKMPKYDPYEEEIKQKFGDKKLVVLTGTSSGLGRKTAQALLRSGEYHVVGAVRDLDKMEAVAEIDGFDMSSFTPMHCELNSFDSVRKFCQELEEFRMSKPIDRLICNAGVYQPSLDHAKWSLDNHEQTMQINFLSHFLMVSLLMDSMMDSPDPRVVMVGSVTGNDNTVGGGGVYPIADLHDMDGFKAGFKNPIAMADGYGFIGAKAYKDSKLCLMKTANLLHYKYHKLTGIAFSSMYPGCIAESPLFREKREWFRKYFPIFMKFITGGFVGEHEAGQRLFQVAHDPRCSKSGVYWSWNGGPREGRGVEALEKGGQISGGGGAGGGWDSIFENDQSNKVLDLESGMKLFEYASEITRAEWPSVKQITSPCPTLKVIGAVTKGMVQREELKRMRELGRPGMTLDGALVQGARTTPPEQVVPVTETPAEAEPVPVEAAAAPVVPVLPKPSRAKRAAMVADRVVGGVLKHTVGRAARFAGKRLLGEIPEEAVKGSFQEDSVVASSPAADNESKEMIQEAISNQLEVEQSEEKKAMVVDSEDEALFQRIYDDSSSAATTVTNVQEIKKVESTTAVNGAKP